MMHLSLVTVVVPHVVVPAIVADLVVMHIPSEIVVPAVVTHVVSVRLVVAAIGVAPRIPWHVAARVFAQTSVTVRTVVIVPRARLTVGITAVSLGVRCLRHRLAS
ncbi:hypothetical protein [Nesterenkonia marinintestina]|uniref:hypothetical protein n=1 Tax=Nesterenkonia marinintestina TaxID=2979865 RepID=UPI0021BE2BDD|nr:hypothetical protein [Nesterenkonia sp. GX14115]